MPGCSAGPGRFNVSVVGFAGAGQVQGRRMRIRRDIPNGYGVEARESFWIRASKAAVLRSKSLLRFRPLVPSRLVKSGRDQDWDAVQGETWIGVVSSRFLLSSRTPSRTRRSMIHFVVSPGLARW